MNTRTMNTGQIEFEDVSAENHAPKFIAIMAAIPALFRNARRVEREAKRLYAMNDAALGEIGMDREQIPSRLLETYAK